MEYKPLKILFHMYDWKKFELEYETRRDSFASYLMNIHIHPIQDGKQKSETCYPLFFVLNKELASNLESVLTNTKKLSYCHLCCQK
ncbi:hypothetical protein [Staphylococcus massiliensis]|uniref:hypothetical protein n=1 Tax=Staphylococcus massiliensis TaxID=555791 RepID=UPI001EDEF87B|nr:hypothetical protein [Staphylococcus massiliensis]